MDEPNLFQRRIAVPETRELDVFASLLERRGAQVLRCPLVAILDAPDPQPVLAWIRAFNSGACDDLILLTGEGLRRLLACIDTHAPDLREPFIQRLSAVRTLVRGPKPGRVLRQIGLKPDIIATEPTSAGIISTLQNLDMSGRRVGVQLYGVEPNLPLQEALRAAGATVLAVAPYVYADAADTQRVIDLIDTLAAGQLDAIAFTSMAQVERLFRVARSSEREADLLVGLQRSLVAAVGPVVAETLSARGVVVQAMPAEDYFMKPLMRALGEALG
ncbi:uroporphyrinogen III synthase [Sinimarinibacterium sp. CAU 1509]|uniref:uroporphyrinogen-III synthase n=1 Tax=Sinimarinibacterium sp. CAU 1509 TaxID=2562283 RepID=UPI0010AC4857|nr:uroporphyrinogen-III synthase [Sinimarinibacterium sp. CAU 1509]TJY59826.1 uroporphyrinogen III synthase [Sinimarinibacterium sp. CAU 1509]